jgi:hypothetical protein
VKRYEQTVLVGLVHKLPKVASNSTKKGGSSHDKSGLFSPILRLRDVTRNILFYRQLGLAGQFRGFATVLGAVCTLQTGAIMLRISR